MLINNKIYFLHAQIFNTFVLFEIASRDSQKFQLANANIFANLQQVLQRIESMSSLAYRTLLSFIDNEDFTGFKSYLEMHQTQVDDRDENGTTALMVVSARGLLEYVRELIIQGADVNGERTLMVAENFETNFEFEYFSTRFRQLDAAVERIKVRTH